jgi:soluble lytic murein transglycosylase
MRGLGELSTLFANTRPGRGVVFTLTFLGALALTTTVSNAQRKVETAALPTAGVAIDPTTSVPGVLAAADVATYKRIFRAQGRGEWKGADADIAKLKDTRLVGHVMAQRYLHATRRTTYAELRNWLQDYSDLPVASSIYELAVKRQPKNVAEPPRPTVEQLKALRFPDDLNLPPDAPDPPGRDLVAEAQGRAAALITQVRQRLRQGELEAAERLLDGRDVGKLLSDGQIDQLRAQIAAGWFAQGDDARAISLAEAAALRSGTVVPRANWITGLAYFRNGYYGDAARYFEALAQTPQGQAWDLAAGAFWAGRSHLRNRRPDLVTPWKSLAAQYPRTFYGLLAIRTLGLGSPFSFDNPTITTADVQTLLRSTGATRAFALMQIGDPERAETELRRVAAGTGVSALRPLLAIALRNNMPGLALRLGRELADSDGRRHDGALFPIPKWDPTGGYDIDRALVFAFMRQESAFNVKALSPAGARGLMQVMPDTAAHLGVARDKLFDPRTNVGLGQTYIKKLLENDVVQGDLIRLAAAYNGGPGNLARWKRKQDMLGDPGDDALVFIESLPAPETRHYITRVLYNYWVYAERLGQPTPSLDLIAAGEWPTYIALDGKARGVARNARN